VSNLGGRDRSGLGNRGGGSLNLARGFDDWVGHWAGRSFLSRNRADCLTGHLGLDECGVCGCVWVQ
jgi:hypothetical protein